MFPDDIQDHDSIHDDTNDNSIEDEDDDNDLNQALKNWVVENNCTRKCVNQILAIFNELNISVPKDSRTLLKTKRCVDFIPMGLGNYVYVCIERCIQKLLNFKKPISNIISLLISLDGLPVFMIKNHKKSKIFMIIK